jgi:hypothetical protein
MSQSAEGRKAVRAFGGGLVYFFPSLISLPLFLVLYNNFYYGNLILVVLILLNVSALMIPQLPGVAPRTASVAKFASLSIVSVVSAVLIIEMLFPFFWPKDYANVLDLSKSFLNDPIEKMWFYLRTQTKDWRPQPRAGGSQLRRSRCGMLRASSSCIMVGILIPRQGMKMCFIGTAKGTSIMTMIRTSLPERIELPL